MNPRVGDERFAWLCCRWQAPAGAALEHHQTEEGAVRATQGPIVPPTVNPVRTLLIGGHQQTEEEAARGT